MYKVINKFRQPVFVEGNRLKIGESLLIETLSDNVKYLKKQGIVSVTSVENSNKETTVITEEGTETINTIKRRKSSKILNE